MITAHLDTLIPVILAGSLAMERLVNLVKTIAPGIFGEPSPAPGGPMSIFAGAPRDRFVPRNREQGRRLLVLVVVYGASLVTAWLLATPVGCGSADAGSCQRVITFGAGDRMPWWLYAILISGGSAMWSNLLGYFSALKDVTAEQRRAVALAPADGKANVFVVNTGDPARAETGAGR